MVLDKSRSGALDDNEKHEPLMMASSYWMSRRILRSNLITGRLIKLRNDSVVEPE